MNISRRAGLCKGQRKVYKSVLSVTFTNSGDNSFYCQSGHELQVMTK